MTLRPVEAVDASRRAGAHAHASPSALARARLASEIVTSLIVTRRAMRRGSIETAVATLRGELPGGSRLAVDRSTSAEANAHLDEARRLGRAVMRTLALMPGDTRCLTRSLVLTRLLARRKIPATLVIGARSAPDFLAHAWVESRGEALLPAGEDAFGRLVEL
jgi:hypothetical protein